MGSFAVIAEIASHEGTERVTKFLIDRRAWQRGLSAPVVAIAVIAAFGGCAKREKPASQVAAKVNSDEISVHQINFVLQRQAGLRPDQAEAAGKVVLERLIDQELAVQKAIEQKLDREPAVLQMLEAAKREVIARAYQDRVAESVPKPTGEEIQSYFDSNPALFRERRIYQLQEVTVESAPEATEALRKNIEQLKSLPEIVDYFKANNVKFAVNQAVRAAEQLPLSAVEAFSKMPDGKMTISSRTGGLQIIVLAGFRMQPVSLEQAKPAIEQYMMNNRRREVVEKAVKDLRAAAKVEYVGSFASAASQPAAPPQNASATASAPLTASSGSGLDASTISKGMGLK